MKKLIVAAVAAIAGNRHVRRRAKTYPSRPITIIVPFAAGGPTDALARILGERMRPSLGQTDRGRERHRRRRHASASAASRARRPTATRSSIGHLEHARGQRRDLSADLTIC